jgi:hypothetical protein
MNLITTLAETDQVGLTATLLLPLVESDPTIDAIRVVRLPTELTTAAQDAQRPVYAARVVRESDGVELVALEPRRLTTAPRRPADDAPAE